VKFGVSAMLIENTGLRHKHVHCYWIRNRCLNYIILLIIILSLSVCLSMNVSMLLSSKEVEGFS